MVPKISVRILSMFAATQAVLVLSPTDAEAQSDYVLWLTPKINDFSFIGDVDALFYGDADAEDRRGDVALSEYRLRLRYPFGRTETSEWIASADVSVFDLGSGPRPRLSHDRLPGELYDESIGVTHRRFLSGDRLVGANLEIGSATDEMFHSVDEMYLKGTAFLTVPHKEYTAWLFYVSADTFREWPVVPGVGYQFPLGRKIMGVVGVPIVGLGGSFTDTLSAEFFYVPLQNVHAKLSYAPAERLKTYVGFDWNRRYFKRVEREDSEDRLRLEQKLFRAGLELSLTETLILDINGGYAFDRTFGEGEDRHEMDDSELELEDAWFGGLGLGVRF